MNKKVIVAVFLIGGSGVVNAAVKGTAITPVILGSYVFLLVLSILDAFGGPFSTLAGGLAMVAAVGVLLGQFPWGTITKAVQKKGAAQEAGTPGQPSGDGNQSRTTT